MGDNFYVFEVLENYQDKLTQGFNELEGIFSKGERFIGWEMDVNVRKSEDLTVFKSNTTEGICIPSSKVKKVYKIEFKEV